MQGKEDEEEGKEKVVAQEEARTKSHTPAVHQTLPERQEEDVIMILLLLLMMMMAVFTDEDEQCL